MLHQFERNSQFQIAPTHDASTLTLRELVGFLRTYWISIALCAVLPVVGAVAYIYVTPRIYTARVQMLLDPKTPQPLAESTDLSTRSLDSPYVESQIAVLRSEKIALTVIDKVGLLRDKELLGDLAVDEANATTSDPAHFSRARIALGQLHRNLDVRRSGISYAIDISYSSRDPARAAEVANTVAFEFLADQVSTRAEAVRLGSNWLEERIEQLRKQMNEAALRVQQFRVKRDYRIHRDGTGPGTRTPAAEPNAANAAQPEAGETLDELESTAQTYRRIYESYLQSYTESVQRQSLPMTNARIITPATPPLSPSAPKKSLILAFALLVGLILGVGQALLRFHMTPPVR